VLNSQLKRSVTAAMNITIWAWSIRRRCANAGFATGMG
jgi:hypothetical protein